ncbi:hypothetical protein AU188_00985 [Mycobacterium sp. IS-3022]|nr:hypothetical protein AU188_00985 [Mycobacterium sp. IS-3022]
MPQHGLHGFDIGAGTDGKGCGGVTEIVRSYDWEGRILLEDPLDRFVEDSAAPVRHSQNSAFGRGEDEVIGLLPNHQDGQFVSKKCGERHHPLLVRLG